MNSSPQLKLAQYSVVFQEVPQEVSLALKISGCPRRCVGCQAPHLQTDEGEMLTIELLDKLIDKYATGITCVLFMGGDASPTHIAILAQHVKDRGYRTAWYSGEEHISWRSNAAINYFDYIKLGPYIKERGGLACRTTNQRFYAIVNGEFIDKTHLFWGIGLRIRK